MPEKEDQFRIKNRNEFFDQSKKEHEEICKRGEKLYHKDKQ